MKKDRLQNINVRRILDRLIGDYQIAGELRSFTYDDIKGALLSETSESRITEALRTLVNEGILQDKCTSAGRPPKYLRSSERKQMEIEKRGKKGNYYQILQNKEALAKIFHIYLDHDIGKLLKSVYINNIIKNSGSGIVYEVIKPYLWQSKFRRISTASILSLQALEAEFLDKSRMVDEFLSNYGELGSNDNEMHESLEARRDLIDLILEKPHPYFWDEQLMELANKIGCRIKSIQSPRIQMLERLDPIKAVPFYRKTIYNEIINLFSEINEKGLITQSAAQFIKYDCYLSPFTSYPTNNLSMLLFAFPFKRIFDDFYLLDEKDLSMLNYRTFDLYNNFGDILFEYFRNRVHLIGNFDQYIRQFIFQWNVSRSIFYDVWSYLSDAYEEKIGSGSYYVHIDGLEIKIKDLESDEHIPEPFERKMIIINPFTESEEEATIDEIRPPIIDYLFAGLETDANDPYTTLISPYSFEGEIENYPTFISYDQILSHLKSRFSDFGWDFDNVASR
jgi:hypothetical protein